MMTATSEGLILATATSVVNVFADVCRKKAVTRNDVLGTSLWMHVAAVVVFAGALVCRLTLFPGPLLHAHGAVFRSFGGGFGAQWPSLATFLLCLVLDGLLLAMAMLYYIRALKVSDLSISVPFLAFTPVLLIPTGYLFLHEMPNLRQALGVVIVVCGAVSMNKEAFRDGLLGPVKAILTDRGSRSMLMVAVIFSVTNPIDKMIVLMSDPVTAAFGYGLTTVLFYSALMWVRGRGTGPSLRSSAGWIVMAGVLYAATQLLQFTSHRYIDVVLTITIKRTGIVLSVLAGWLIFRERHIEDRLAAAFAMVCGAVLIYLPLSEESQILIACVVLVVLVFNLGRRSHAALKG
jgi:drug/metabolite transporter (DMT)-like permease